LKPTFIFLDEEKDLIILFLTTNSSGQIAKAVKTSHIPNGDLTRLVYCFLARE